MVSQRATTIGHICTDNKRRIIMQIAYSIRECPILMPRTFIKEAIRTVLQLGMPKIILKTDSHITIKSILGPIALPTCIRNLVEDINVHINAFEYIQSFIVLKIVNRLAYRLAKKAHFCNCSNSMDKFPLVFLQKIK